jgi:5'-methylthioinosine phosphorylase
MSKLAVIGGTGVNRLEGLVVHSEHPVETPYGQPSHPVLSGRFAGAECLFLARHGVPHHIAPHRINYRANLWALRELGATEVIGVNAVGGIHGRMPTGTLVVPDQLIDYTWGREASFYDGEAAELRHIDFTSPYCASLRTRLVTAAASLGIAHQDFGTYGVTQGPRLETAAEIRRLANDGCDLVGMTGMPEAALAAELALPYASLCLVVNPAAGLGDEPITLESMQAVLEEGSGAVADLLSAFLQASDLAPQA